MLATEDIPLDAVANLTAGGAAAFSPSAHTIIGAYLVVIGILGTAGNIVVVITFLRIRALLTPTSLLLINLALADLGILVFGFPFSASSSFANRWLYGDGGCQVYAFLGFLFGSAHIGNLAVLALDRYLVTCRVGFKGKLTYRRYCQLITSVWLYALFWALMPLLGWARYDFEPTLTTCTIDWRNNDASYKSFLLVYFVLGYFVPLCLITICYKSSAKHIRSKRLPSSYRDAMNDKWANEANVTWMSFIVVVAFVLAWSPYAVLCMWTVFGEPMDVPPLLAIIPPLFAKTSSMFNPVIYFFTNPRLRVGLLSTLLCCQEPPAEIIEIPEITENTGISTEN